MNTQNSVRDYTKSQKQYERNSAQDDPIFKEIINLVSSPNFNKVTLHNLLRQFGASQKGLLFVRLIPHLNIENKSYRSIAKRIGFSHEQIRDWVLKHGPEVLKKSGGDKS